MISPITERCVQARESIGYLSVYPAAAKARDTLAEAANTIGELVEQVELFVRCIEYEIRVSRSKGDDEGANLKELTLHFARAALQKAKGEIA